MKTLAWRDSLLLIAGCAPLVLLAAGLDAAAVDDVTCQPLPSVFSMLQGDEPQGEPIAECDFGNPADDELWD